MTRRLALLVALAAAACSPKAGERTSDSGKGCAGAGDVVVADVWARETKAGQSMSAAYLTLCNGGAADDALVSVSSPNVATIEIHESMKSAEGVSGMRQIEGVTLAPGAPVTFAPGGRHLMLIDLKGPLETGKTLPLTLTFRSGAAKTVEAEIRPAHGGHHH